MSSEKSTIPNYRAIATELRHGRVVPVIGSGASSGQDKCPPNVATLRQVLLSEIGYAESNLELADIASLAEADESQINLRSRLNDLYKGVFKIPELYTWLAELDQSLTIISTNYDRLLEESFEDAGRKYHLVVYCGDWAEHGNSVLWKGPEEDTARPVPAKTFDWNPKEESLIFKIHGTALPDGQRGTFVVTQEDYTGMMLRLMEATAVPKAIITHLRECSLLFLGHGLRGFDLEVLRRMTTHQRNMRNWAVQLAPNPKTVSETDQDLERQIWRWRGVHLLQVDLEDFLLQLRAAYANA